MLSVRWELASPPRLGAVTRKGSPGMEGPWKHMERAGTEVKWRGMGAVWLHQWGVHMAVITAQWLQVLF